VSRPLAEILLDLETTRSAWQKIADAEQRAWDDPDAAAELGDELAPLDDKLDELRTEYRATFKELTGVDWSNVEHATMSGAL
jgi:hypothetical protein